MAVTNYYTVNGEIIGEHTTGHSRLDYLCDALGSVVATVDQTQTVKSTARYKPYGADLSTTGTQPSFGWVGSLGYRRTARPHADIYVRARTFATSEGEWTSTDPSWPAEAAFQYASGSPALVIDPSGLAACLRMGRPCKGSENEECERDCSKWHLGSMLDCEIRYKDFGLAWDLVCTCECPSPAVSASQAFQQGEKRLPGKCQLKRKGTETDADSCGDGTGPGTHQTWIYNCPGKVSWKVSVLCCPCKTADGGSQVSCFPIVQKAGKW